MFFKILNNNSRSTKSAKTNSPVPIKRYSGSKRTWAIKSAARKRLPEAVENDKTTGRKFTKAVDRDTGTERALAKAVERDATTRTKLTKTVKRDKAT